MSDAQESWPKTALRRTYERIRALPPQAQLGDCVDQLGNPEVLVAEFLEACCEIEAHSTRQGSRAAAAAPAGEPEEILLEQFYAGLEVTVSGPELAGFTCLASDVETLPGARRDPGARDGLDYVGFAAAEGRPILGALQSAQDATPYLVLLRLLACSAEIAPKSRLAWLDRAAFGGRLGPAPRFDLHLVLWEANPTPLDALTRDLAEVVKRAAREDSLFPEILGRISAHRMNPADFTGRLRLDWTI